MQRSSSPRSANNSPRPSPAPACASIFGTSLDSGTHLSPTRSTATAISRRIFAYEPGEASYVVIFRAFYEWNITAKLPKEIGLSNMSNGNRLLAATAVFRNEPFKK
jgi:hypothetical protein